MDGAISQQKLWTVDRLTASRTPMIAYAATIWTSQADELPVHLFKFIIISGAWIPYGIVEFNVPLDTVEAGALSASLIQQWRASDIIIPLTGDDFVYNGLKAMVLAPNPSYSGVSYIALWGSFKSVTLTPKNRKGDDSTAQ